MRFPAVLLISLLIAYGISYFVTIKVSPEIKFWNEVVEYREAAILKIREQRPNTPIILFTGGSSCAFSIDPKIIEKSCELPSVNLGLPVAAGPGYILHQALREARSGDIIVVCLEPDLLTFADQDSSPSKVGFGIEASHGNFTAAAGGITSGKKMGISDYLTLTRPGANYLVTLAGRTLGGKGYRYKTDDIKYRGLLVTNARDQKLEGSSASMSVSLHPEGKQLLVNYEKAAKSKGVDLVYSMPWYFTASQDLDLSRRNKRQLMAKISEIMPVVDDGYSGAMDKLEYFADSGLHLSREGATLRSNSLGLALKSFLEHTRKDSKRSK